MNKVFEIGNICNQPEITVVKNGKKICRFSIAVNRNYSSANGEKKTDFFKCVAWNGTAENVAKYCSKGSKISIIGSLENESYTDKNGNKRNEVVIVVGETEFLQTKSSSGGNNQTQNKGQLIAFDDEGDMPF